MKKFDCFLFYNELDLLELRLNVLNDSVDHFVINEARETFSGKVKPLFFLENRERFKKFESKIIHNVIDSSMSLASPPPFLEHYFTHLDLRLQHKHGGKPVRSLHESVRREIYQRDSIIVGLNGLADKEDIILLSDVDEIPDPNVLEGIVSRFDNQKVYHFEQRWFIYWINNLCNRRWFGTRAFSYGLLDGKSLDQMRFPTEDSTLFNDDVINNAGWHFSYLGGVENIRNKLDSLAHQGKRATITKFLNSIFPGRIKKMLLANKDILLQGKQCSRIIIDDSYPAYLRMNLYKYIKWIADDHH